MNKTLVTEFTDSALKL